MPDMQTYELVIRACSQQSLFECAEMLLSAAEAQGLPYQSLLWGCLEGSSDNAFVVKWAPKALEANLKIPARCFVMLLRDRASAGGSKLAVALFKLLLRVGSPEEKAAEALVQSIAEIHQLQYLPDVMRQMQCPNQRVNGLISKLADKMSVTTAPPPAQAPSSVADEASTYIDITDSEPCSPPPGLPPPVSLEDAGEFLEALQQSQDKQDVAAALKTP